MHVWTSMFDHATSMDLTAHFETQQCEETYCLNSTLENGSPRLWWSFGVVCQKLGTLHGKMYHQNAQSK